MAKEYGRFYYLHLKDEETESLKVQGSGERLGQYGWKRESLSLNPGLNHDLSASHLERTNKIGYPSLFECLH